MAIDTKIERWDDEKNPGRFAVTVTFAYEEAPKAENGNYCKITAKHTRAYGKTKGKGKPQDTHDVVWDEVVTIRTYPDDAPDPDERLWYVTVQWLHESFSGEFEVTVKWKPFGTKTEKTLKRKFSAGEIVNQATVVERPTAHPRLGMMMLGPLLDIEKPKEPLDPPWDPNANRATREQMVAKIATHLFAGLNRGLGHFWEQVLEPGCCSADGHALRNADPSMLSPEQLEECWAQHFTEMTLGVNYGAMGSAMGAAQVPDGGATGPHAQDAWVFRQYVGSDPVYPIQMACQQLATLGVLTRGHSSLAVNPLDSHTQLGALQDKQTGNLAGKQLWVPSPLKDPRYYPAEPMSIWQVNGSGGYSAERGFAEHLLKPGACFWGNVTQAHVAVLLRAIKHEEVLQLLDTGGWIDDNDYDLGGGRDTTFVEVLQKGNATYTGVMVPPASPDLKGAIARMRQARPLGVARLVVGLPGWDQAVSPDPSLVYWVSPFLPMLSGDERFSVARYIASLRGCPYAKNLDVRWQIFMPRAKEYLERAVANEVWYEAWVDAANKKHNPNPTPGGVLEIAVNKNGLPEVKARWPNNGKALEFETTKRDYEYFRDMKSELDEAALAGTEFPHGAGLWLPPPNDPKPLVSPEVSAYFRLQTRPIPPAQSPSNQPTTNPPTP